MLHHAAGFMGMQPIGGKLLIICGVYPFCSSTFFHLKNPCYVGYIVIVKCEEIKNKKDICQHC